MMFFPKKIEKQFNLAQKNKNLILLGPAYYLLIMMEVIWHITNIQINLEL